MFGLGTQELLVILVIMLVLFGANKLPLAADWTHCPRCGMAVPQDPNIRIGPGA